jgi:hypothetical protein
MTHYIAIHYIAIDGTIHSTIEEARNTNENRYDK